MSKVVKFPNNDNRVNYAIFSCPSGEVKIQSADQKMTYERCMFLLKQAEARLMREWMEL